MPIAKQLGMKDIDIVRNKAIGTVGDAAGKAIPVDKDGLVQLI